MKIFERIGHAIALFFGYGGDIDAHPARDWQLYARDGWEVWVTTSHNGCYGYYITHNGVVCARSEQCYDVDVARSLAIAKLAELRRLSND